MLAPEPHTIRLPGGMLSRSPCGVSVIRSYFKSEIRATLVLVSLKPGEHMMVTTQLRKPHLAAVQIKIEGLLCLVYN